MTTASETVLYASFSLEHSSITIGTTEGFYVFASDPLKLRYYRNWGMGIKIVEILMRSNVVALVGGGPDPKWPEGTLVLWDDHENKEINFTSVGESINSVKIRKEMIIVAIDSNIILYSNSLKRIGVINTLENPLGVTCISNAPGPILLGTLATTPGTVSLQRATLVKDDAAESDEHGVENWEIMSEMEIKAHQNGIVAMCISNDGSFVATASEKGTLIRVYKVSTGKLVKEFRRGLKAVMITGLMLSSDNSLLLVSSNTGTIHLFDLTSEYILNVSINDFNLTFYFYRNDRSVMKFYSGFDCPVACFGSSEKQSVITISTRNGTYSKYSYDVSRTQKTSRAEIVNYNPFKLIQK